MAKRTVKKMGKNPGETGKKQREWGPKTWANVVTLAESAIGALAAGDEAKVREVLRGIRSLAQPEL